MKIKYILSILFVLLNFKLAFQQNKVNVVTRKVVKEFKFNSLNEKIIIDAEKATILIKSWDNLNVKVKLNLKTKNTDVELARKELNYLKYNANKRGKEILVKNNILLSSNIEKLSSKVEVEYEIWIPDNVKMVISNKFGNILLENVKASIESYVEYCDIKL